MTSLIEIIELHVVWNRNKKERERKPFEYIAGSFFGRISKFGLLSSLHESHDDDTKASFNSKLVTYQINRLLKCFLGFTEINFFKAPTINLKKYPQKLDLWNSIISNRLNACKQNPQYNFVLIHTVTKVQANRNDKTDLIWIAEGDFFLIEFKMIRALEINLEKFLVIRGHLIKHIYYIY